jgi:hypothetical protein
MIDAEWSGMERRTTDALGKFNAMLQDHTKEEMERYAEILDQQDQITNKLIANSEASMVRDATTQDKIRSLTQSINSFITGSQDFMASVKRAFPKDDMGHPDYDGHRGAHLAWITNTKESKELIAYIKKVVLGAAAIALSSWVVMLIWQGALHGPVK